MSFSDWSVTGIDAEVMDVELVLGLANADADRCGSPMSRSQSDLELLVISDEREDRCLSPTLG